MPEQASVTGIRYPSSSQSFNAKGINSFNTFKHAIFHHSNINNISLSSWQSALHSTEVSTSFAMTVFHYLKHTKWLERPIPNKWVWLVIELVQGYTCKAPSEDRDHYSVKAGSARLSLPNVISLKFDTFMSVCVSVCMCLDVRVHVHVHVHACRRRVWQLLESSIFSEYPVAWDEEMNERMYGSLCGSLYIRVWFCLSMHAPVCLCLGEYLYVRVCTCAYILVRVGL